MAQSVQAIKTILSDKLQTDLSFGPKWECFEEARKAGFNVRVRVTGLSGYNDKHTRWEVKIIHLGYDITVIAVEDTFVDTVSEAFRKLFDRLDDWEVNEHRQELDRMEATGFENDRG